MPETAPGLTELVTPCGEDSVWLCTNFTRAIEYDALGREAQCSRDKLKPPYLPTSSLEKYLPIPGCGWTTDGWTLVILK